MNNNKDVNTTFLNESEFSTRTFKTLADGRLLDVTPGEILVKIAWGIETGPEEYEVRRKQA